MLVRACEQRETRRVHFRMLGEPFMSSDSDSSTGRAPRRFLTSLRDVLFENTDTVVPPAAGPSLGNVAVAQEGDLTAARTALRDSVGERLGPAVREFALQVEALREVLPSTADRQRAALKVLALKGISAPALVLELEHALAALAEQNQAFESKLATRQQALDTERERLELLARECEQQLADCERHGAELASKKLGFERAYAEVYGEYRELKEQLTTSNPTEKVQ
jgi:hypothetical protein